MKLFNKYILAVIVITMLASCEKDYLETKPTNSTSPDDVFATTKSAAGAINGLAKLMTQQKLGSQGYNGEGTIKMWYGNYPGNNFSFNLASQSSVVNLEYYSNPTSSYTYYPWFYYYSIIGNANTVIASIDKAAGPEKEKQFIKAQALTFRAYSYTMLAQLYGNRWKDSQNGATNAVVLRTEPTSTDLPLSSLADTYKLIYEDLNTAITLYAQSGLTRTAAQFYLPDVSVAYATFARAALNREDYVNAETYANKARANHALMTVAQYKSGFNTSNSEWIWGSYGALDESLFFYSYHAYIAYNSTAGNVKNSPKSMSKTLWTKIPTTDIRKNLFLDPKTYVFDPTTGLGNAAAFTYARSLYPLLQSDARAYPYMQFKISNTDQAGVGNLNHFRSSEMILIEAEAKYFLNKPAADIQALMNTLTKTSLRDPDYNCVATGANLLAEIKTYRGIELWGEGFDFFDLKRWGDKIERKSYADGGSFVPTLNVTIEPTERNKWTIVTPARETDYNDLIN